MDYVLQDRLYMLSEREKVELILNFLLCFSEYSVFGKMADEFLKERDL
jgi:hypothetical protein